MTENNLIYNPYASFTNAQLPPLLKIEALWFDMLVILDTVGARRWSVGHELHDCNSAKPFEMLVPGTGQQLLI